MAHRNCTSWLHLDARPHELMSQSTAAPKLDAGSMYFLRHVPQLALQDPTLEVLVRKGDVRSQSETAGRAIRLSTEGQPVLDVWHAMMQLEVKDESCLRPAAEWKSSIRPQDRQLAAAPVGRGSPLSLNSMSIDWMCVYNGGIGSTSCICRAGCEGNRWSVCLPCAYCERRPLLHEKMETGFPSCSPTLHRCQHNAG